MSPAKLSAVTVLRVDQSPLNARRWSLSLSCGHDEWVTSVKKPTRKTAQCSECSTRTKREGL